MKKVDFFIIIHQYVDEEDLNFILTRLNKLPDIQVAAQINPAKLKPGAVVKAVNESYQNNFNHYDHKCLLYIFSIKPTKEDVGSIDPFETNTKYCHYDEAHNDYLFKEEWNAFIISNITSGTLTREIWKSNFDNKQKLEISTFEIE